MVDKVKPIGYENLTDGGDSLPVPTELDPTEDYTAVKGVAFENSDNTTIHGDSGVMKFKDSEETSDATLRDLKKDKVSQNDTTPGYLEDKIVAGSGMSIATLNDGANETLELSTTPENILIAFHFKSEGNNVFNKWLGFGSSSSGSNDSPWVAPQDFDIKGVVFANDDDSSDTDIEVYINGVLEFTSNVIDKWTYYDVGTTKASGSQGDRISVFLSKVGSTPNAPSNPVVSLYCKFTDEVTATGGEQENND